MMQNKTYFRSSIVGGYNKEDVHRCIQEMKKVSEEELITSEEIIGELNVQMEEQKNDFEVLLEDQRSDLEERMQIQKDRYEAMLEEQRQEYEARLADNVRVEIEPRTVEVEAAHGEVLELKRQCDEWSNKYEILNVKYEDINEKNRNLHSKNQELNAKHDDLAARYNKVLQENESVQSDLQLLNEKKDLLFNFEMDARQRAEKLVDEARGEAEEIVKSAENRAMAMIQDSRSRVELSMKKYIKLCDEHRIEAHASAISALKLQRQVESAVAQLAVGSEEMKQKLSELYKATEEEIDFFDEN